MMILPCINCLTLPSCIGICASHFRGAIFILDERKCSLITNYLYQNDRYYQTRLLEFRNFIMYKELRKKKTEWIEQVGY